MKIKKILSSILYIFCIVLAFFFGLFSVVLLESITGRGIIEKHTIYLVFFFWGTAVCGGASYFLLRFERTKIPTVVDHLRHSFLAYVMFTVLFIGYLESGAYKMETKGALFGTVIVGMLCVGIIANAIVLHIYAKRY